MVGHCNPPQRLVDVPDGESINCLAFPSTSVCLNETRGRLSSLFDNWSPAAQDESRVAVVGDGLDILRHGELSGYRVTLSGVDGTAIEVGAVELPKVQMDRIVIDGTPADCGDVLEMAVDQNSFGVGIVEAMVIGQAGEYCSHRSASQGDALWS